MDVVNNIVVVTGAARGIGLSLAQEYASQGANVVLVDINGKELTQAVESIAAAGQKAHGYQVDLASDHEVKSLAASVIKEVGVPDIIHNNAVLIRSGDVLNLSLDDVKCMFDVNVLGYLRIIQGFAPAMISRGKGGWIANTASPNGLMPAHPLIANVACYNMCKAADISLSQSAAITLKPHRIGVSVVFPDVVHTKAVDELSGTSSQEFKDEFVRFMGSLGAPPAEVAEKIVQGVKEGSFFVNAYSGCEGLMKQWTEHLLDPNFDNHT